MKVVVSTATIILKRLRARVGGSERACEQLLFIWKTKQTNVPEKYLIFNLGSSFRLYQSKRQHCRCLHYSTEMSTLCNRLAEKSSLVCTFSLFLLFMLSQVEIGNDHIFF